MRQRVVEFLTFYEKLGRPLTVLEIARGVEGNPQSMRAVLDALDELLKEGVIQEEEGFFALRGTRGGFSLARRVQDALLDTKWRYVVRRAKIFSYVPFLQFVLGGGSMALGNVKKDSDFDMLIAVRKERMFLARYILIFYAALLGMRRRDDIHGSSPRAMCFNHFITEETFSKPPHNTYRKELYRNLVPLYGDKNCLETFARENAWAEIPEYVFADSRFQENKKHILIRVLEWLFSGSLGDTLEAICAHIAKKRLSRYIQSKENKGRVIVSDAELEFHFSLPYER